MCRCCWDLFGNMANNSCPSITATYVCILGIVIVRIAVCQSRGLKNNWTIVGHGHSLIRLTLHLIKHLLTLSVFGEHAYAIIVTGAGHHLLVAKHNRMSLCTDSVRFPNVLTSRQVSMQSIYDFNNSQTGSYVYISELHTEIKQGTPILYTECTKLH